MVGFLALATLAWQASQGPGNDLPQPAFGLFATGAAIGFYGMVAPLLHLRPFRGPPSPPSALRLIGTPTSAPAPTLLPKGDRSTDLDRTPEDLWGLFDGLTDLQAASIIRPFLNQWLSVSGEVSSVGAWYDTFLGVDLVRGGIEDGHIVHATFTDQRSVDRLSLVKRGDQMTVRGSISGIHRLALELYDCELVEPE